MTDLATDLVRPRGRYGVDGDYRLIPAPVVLAAESMLRPDLRLKDLDYTLPTIVFGFFAAEPFHPPAITLTLDQKADQLAQTIRRAFEPTNAPSSDTVKRAAAKALPILERLAENHWAATYGGDHDD